MKKQRARELSSAAVVIALSAGCGALTDPGEDVATLGDPASTAITASSFYRITNRNSGKCVDDTAWGTANGTAVQQYGCGGDQANQQWQLRPTDSGYYNVLSRHAPSQGWDVAGGPGATGTGVKVQLWGIGGSGSANQQWLPVALGGGYYRFVARHSGKCLDVPSSSIDNGVVLQQWDCNGTAAQAFLLQEVGAPAQGWRLIWSDEFNGPSGADADPSRWSHDVGGGGWGNGELQYYTAGNRNASQQSGALVIEARRENPAGSSCWYGACQYSSARLISAGKFTAQYGRFEARIKIPGGQGIWPAFWMLGANIGAAGWPTCGEIDIMENIGREPSRNHGSLHGPGYSGGSPLTGWYDQPGARLGDDFHVYAAEWEASAVRFYVDGHLYQTRTPRDLPAGARWVYDHPFFLLLNVAVGGAWPGSPDGGTPLPQRMLVDYVRVYQR